MTHIRSLRSALARPLLSRVRGGRESSGGLLSPTAAGRLGAVLFLAAATATAVSLATPAAEDHHRLAHVLVSVASGLAGLVAWHSPWRRWPPAAMRWTLAPAALVLIAATNHYGGLHHYSSELAYLLVFAWVGVTQPRWTSLGLAAPLAAAYLLPLLAAGRPTSELFVAGVVVPGVVAFGEGCAWVGSRLRAAECALRAAEAGIERLLEATTALGRAETEAEVAALTADLVMDLLGADRVQVMATEEQGSSRFVNRGQRNMPVPVGEVVIDAATEPSGTALAVHNGRTVFISDARSSSVISARLVRMVPSASAAFIPLPGEGGFLGAIVVLWDTPRAGLDPFSQRAAEVLSVETGQAFERTRASARLARDLGEHRRTESHLRRERSFLELLQGVAVAANEARTVDEGVQRALDQVCAYTSWPVGHAYLPNPEGVLASSSLWHMDDPDRFDPFRLVTEQVRFGPGVGLLGRAVLSKEPVWVPDITIDGTFPRAAAARDAGLRAALGVPVVVAGEVVAVLEFFWLEAVEPDQSLLELARHVGTQLGRVVERRRSEATLQASEERARAVIETAGDAFIGMDDNGLVTAWNRQAEVTFGWARHEVLGQPVADLIIPEHLRARHRAGLKHFQETGEEAILGRRLDVSARRRDGREFPVELSVWATRIGSSFGFSAFARDISDRQRLKDELVRQALHDPLTGLPNRTLLLDRLGHALARGERSRAPVTVLFLDLDGFKKINDSLGHAAGDRLLAAVAERLLSVVRTQDTIARLGGDEFAVLLEEMGTVDGVHVAVRVGTALDQPFVIDGHHVLAPASVGIASGNPGEHTADDLLRNADLAMYMAKSKGTARYAVYESEMHVALVERLELEADLRRAVGMAHFFLLFQPVVRLADGSVVGMEALIRWKRAGGAVVSPDQFISVAEEIGLIGEIGRWVLQEACIQAAAWQAEHRPTPALRLSVNLSARQLQDPGLVKDVEAVLAASGLDPACLVIEITESLLMSEPDVAIQRLGDLKDLGVQLAIDDFGTGYSSLSYLRRFPVDVLKVDRSFVTALGRDPDDAALTHAIVKLGQTLHLRVVAEGIETADELAELRALGCEYGQGYLFARPLTAEAMSAVLDNAGQGRTLLPPGTPDGAFPREAVPGMVR